MIIKSSTLFGNPIVSVVITSFNRGQTIGNALDSILNQQHVFPIEIIVGDDFSDDDSRKVLLQYHEKYPQNIVLLFHEKNLGLVGNWASCVQLSRGKYIAFCDDDDYWCDNEKLRKQISFLEDNPDFGLIHTNYNKYYEKSNRIVSANLLFNKEPENLMLAIFKGQYLINPGTVCVRMDLVKNHIYLDDYIKNKFPIQDFPTWIILAKYTKFAYINDITYMYRMGVESMSNPTSYSKIETKFLKEKEMYKYLCDKFPEDLHYDEQGYNNYITRILLSLAYKKSDFVSAKKYGNILLLSGDKTLKAKSSKYKLLFLGLFWAIKIKSLFSNK